jgi:hypothetical protein
VQARVVQGAAPLLGERPVLLAQAKRKDQVDGQAGPKSGLGGQGVHAGLATGEHAAAWGAPQLSAQAALSLGCGRDGGAS